MLKIGKSVLYRTTPYYTVLYCTILYHTILYYKYYKLLQKLYYRFHV